MTAKTMIQKWGCQTVCKGKKGRVQQLARDRRHLSKSAVQRAPRTPRERLWGIARWWKKSHALREYAGPLTNYLDRL